MPNKDMKLLKVGLFYYSFSLQGWLYNFLLSNLDRMIVDAILMLKVLMLLKLNQLKEFSCSKKNLLRFWKQTRNMKIS